MGKIETRSEIGQNSAGNEIHRSGFEVCSIVAMPRGFFYFHFIYRLFQ